LGRLCPPELKDPDHASSNRTVAGGCDAMRLVSGWGGRLRVAGRIAGDQRNSTPGGRSRAGFDIARRTSNGRPLQGQELVRKRARCALERLPTALPTLPCEKQDY